MRKFYPMFSQSPGWRRERKRKEETKGNQQTSKNKARQHECLWNVRNVIVALKECIVILRNFFKLTSIFLKRTLFSSSLSASSNSKSSITCVWSKSISQKTCFCIASQLKILRIPQAILITPFSELPLPWSFDVISRTYRVKKKYKIKNSSVMFQAFTPVKFS